VVKDNTITIKDTDKLVKEIDQMRSEMETAELMVRQLQQELAQRAADEDERLAKAQADAALLGGDDTEGGASTAEVVALREEVAVLRHKNQKLLHHKILHRVLKAQSETAFLQLRESHSEQTRLLSEAEDLLAAKECENLELAARNDELERIILAMQAGQPFPVGIALPQGAASHPDDWREDMIAKAEVELKAAMASGDPERLKAAIANASATVAKARARGSTVVKKQQVLHGDGADMTGTDFPNIQTVVTMQSVRIPASAAQAGASLSEEEHNYIRFHQAATDRKLALASRGYEVQDIFIDTMYDAALAANVPSSEWGEFLRLQMPSPRATGADEIEEATAAAGAPATDGADGVSKVRSAVKKVANLIGWRAKFAEVKTSIVAAPELMERPDDMPIAEPGPLQRTPVLGTDPHAGKSLHDQALVADIHVADSHLKLMHISEPKADSPLLSPGGTESRAMRYNQRLRERIDQREQKRTPRPDE